MAENSRRGAYFEGLGACLGREKQGNTADRRVFSTMLLNGKATGEKGLASGETRNMNHQRMKLWNVWSSSATSYVQKARECREIVERKGQGSEGGWAPCAVMAVCHLIALARYSRRVPCAERTEERQGKLEMRRWIVFGETSGL